MDLNIPIFKSYFKKFFLTQQKSKMCQAMFEVMGFSGMQRTFAHPKGK